MWTHKKIFQNKAEAVVYSFHSWNGYVVTAGGLEVKICKSDLEEVKVLPYKLCSVFSNHSKLFLLGMGNNTKTEVTLGSIDEKLNLELCWQKQLGQNDTLSFKFGCVWNNSLVIVGHSSVGATLFLFEKYNVQNHAHELLFNRITSMVVTKQNIWILAYLKERSIAQLLIFRHETDLINYCYYSPNDSESEVILQIFYWSSFDVVACGCETGSIQIRDSQNGQLLKLFKGHEKKVRSFCAWDDKLYSGCEQEIRLWNFDGVCLDIISCPYLPTSLCMHKGRLYVSCNYPVNTLLRPGYMLCFLGRPAWSILRVLWIGNMKNSREECVLSLIPTDILREIIRYL